MQHDLTQGSVWKKLIRFALPILGANFLQAMYGTVDLLIVGRFCDASAVSAVSTGSMIMHTLTCIITGLAMGCTILLGHSIGQKDYKAAQRAISSSLVLFILCGILVSVLFVAVTRPLARVMNAPAEAFDQTCDYVFICGLGTICIVLFNALSSIFRGLGDSRTPLLLVAVACVCNIFGDLLLVGVFDMGAAGAAVATVAAQGISVLFAFVISSRRGGEVTISLRGLRIEKRESIAILKYGLPIAAQEALTGVSFMVILAILNDFGLIASAGVGVAEKLCGLIFLVPGAFMSAVSAFSAQNYGAGSLDRAKKSMCYGIAISFVFGLVMFSLCFFSGDALASIFTSEPEVIAAAADYMRSYAIDCVIASVNFCMIGYFNGMGKTAFVAAQGLSCSFLVRIPFSYFMSKIEGVSLFLIGFATPLATVAGILMNLFYFARLRRSIPALRQK